MAGMALQLSLIRDFVNFTAGHEYQGFAFTGARCRTAGVGCTFGFGGIRRTLGVTYEASHICCHRAESKQRQATNKS